MLFTDTNIEGAHIIDIRRIQDERGFFSRTYCSKEFEKRGLNSVMVQTNISSTRLTGTLRGLHLQEAPYGEAKLVRCTRGAIYDVLVDVRENSPTFLQWFGIELTANNFRMLYIPEGCAHGYLTLADDTDVMYQVSQYYKPESEKGYLWNDSAFKIKWPIQPILISSKDQSHPLFYHKTLTAPSKS